jgi:putative endonuclease
VSRPRPAKLRTERRRAYRRGRRGERLALWWLRLKGYRILAHDLRAPGGEIDIIARRGRTIAVIEVKWRDSLAGAVEAILPRQRARILRAVGSFLARHPHYSDHAVRFDVMLVAPRRWPRHLPDAWRESDSL